jgi:glycosyltransferase involved in cell wall biosynthesis
VTPARWRHEYSADSFASRPLPELASRFIPQRAVLLGRPQRHFYVTNPFRIIRRCQPSVVFCEQEPFALSAAQWGLSAHLLGLPFGVQLAENLDRPMPLAAKVIRSVILSRAAFVAARSEAACDLAARWGTKSNVQLIPHHVPNWPVPARVTRDVFTVGFAGRLVPEKGLDTLVAAVRRLTPPVDLLVAGDGPLRGWLQSVDLGAARLVMLSSTQHSEMADVYAKMDVLALPSRTTQGWTEQFGRVLVEAMWCGTPVVGSDSGEIPWVINMTGGGLVFREGDDSSLFDELHRLRIDHALRSRLARQGRMRVNELFSVSAVADRIENVLLAAQLTRHRR